MAKRKSEKLDGNIGTSGYSNTDALISDQLLRSQLASIRKSKMTQKEMAKLSGLSVACISNIENCASGSPTLRSLIKYTSALGVDLYINLVK